MTDTSFPSIPGYRILEVLGEGGMATVYLAVQELLERHVALKVMKPTENNDPAFGRRFLREARIASQLAHPNIITVYEVGVHEGIYYLSMEYIAGPDLKRARQSLSVRQKLGVLLDVANALAFAASKGYVHRDVKPENVLLREPGMSAVLMDFGIARSAQPDLDMTQVGASLGTPNYMSPEQIRGDPLDYRSDFYSLGVVLYFLMTERLPFVGDSAVAVGIKHLTEPVPQLNGPLAALQGILERLMAKQPEHRYQSARELIDDLQKVDIAALEAQLALTDASTGDKASDERRGDVDQTDTMIGTQWLASLKAPSPAGSPDGPSRRYRAVLYIILLTVVSIPAAVWLVSQPRAGKDPNVTIAQTAGQGHDDSAPSSSSLPKLPDLSNVSGERSRPTESLSWADRLFGKSGDSIQAQIEELKRQRDRQGWNQADRRRWNELAGEAFNVVRSQLESGQFTVAQEQLARYRTLFSDHWREHQRDYQDILALLAVSDRLQTLRQQAEQALSDGRLVTPRDESALGYYLQMLELHEDYPLALQGLKTVVDRLRAHAEESYQQGSWGRAYAYAQYILQMQPEDRRAREMTKIIENYQLEENQVREWAAQAQALAEAGHLFFPQEGSAYSHYQQILEVRPGHEESVQGLQSVRETFQSRVEDMLAKGEVEFAQYEVDAAQQAAPNEAFLQRLADSVQRYAPNDSKRGAAASSGPRIMHAWVGDTPNEGWLQDAPTRLRSGHTLHGAVQYEGFARDVRQVVSAVLENESGALMESVPIVLSRPFGETRFRIDRAVEPFRSGRYRLRFLLDERELKRVDFAIVD